LDKTAKISIDAQERIAREIRASAIRMSARGKASHLGSSLSCIDILVAIYWQVLSVDPKFPDSEDRDRFLLSKGHAAQALYATLARRGFFDESLLETYNQAGGQLAEHPGPNCVPGIEAATGSLGHGLPIGVGLALAAKVRKSAAKVVVLLGDGECNEGSVWEAAMLAPALDLNNLCVVVDFNKWQATDRSKNVMALASLPDKWAAFNWTTKEVDGHDLNALADAFKGFPEESQRPTAIIAHTVKGKGVSFMEDDNNWHYRIPSEEEAEAAYKELGIQ
jgi:transketolase